MKLIIRLIINAIALYIAVALVPGIDLVADGTQPWVAYLLLGLVFGLLNALLRPLLMVLTCPFIILTLGLGTLLINTLLFYLTGWIGRSFGWGFTIDNIISAFLGALVVSVVSIVLSLLLKDSNEDRIQRSR